MLEREVRVGYTKISRSECQLSCMPSYKCGVFIVGMACKSDVKY